MNNTKLKVGVERKICISSKVVCVNRIFFVKYKFYELAEVSKLKSALPTSKNQNLEACFWPSGIVYFQFALQSIFLLSAR